MAKRVTLNDFAQSLGIPVVTTLMGIGAIDTTHPLAMRMLGMHGTALPAARSGLRFPDRCRRAPDDRVASDPESRARCASRRFLTAIAPGSTRSSMCGGIMSACWRRHCADGMGAA
jgi:acetolactate synthase-1/2/3 large subunit